MVSTTTIEKGPDDLEAEVQSEVVMDCEVLWDRSYKLNIIWKKDNVDIDFAADPDRIKLGPKSSLVISDLEFDDAGRNKKCFPFFLVLKR